MIAASNQQRRTKLHRIYKISRIEEYLLVSFGKGRFEGLGYVEIISEILDGLYRYAFKNQKPLINNITEM